MTNDSILFSFAEDIVEDARRFGGDDRRHVVEMGRVAFQCDTDFVTTPHTAEFHCVFIHN